MAEYKICQICNISKSKYFCPRCNILYCSVTCYQSETHLQCSESFYSDCVLEELKTNQFHPDAKKKMLEILKQQQQESDSDQSLDSDDEETTPDLIERMMNVNLDDEEAVWEKLTAEEKHEFRKFISSGDIIKILPDWEPWWKVMKRKTFIQDSQENFDWKTLCPKVLTDIPELSKLTKANPSPQIPFMLLNVLISYTFTVRWFKGIHLDMPVEGISTCIALSAVLRANEVFQNPIQAVVAFKNDLSKCCWLYDYDDYDKNLMQEDLKDIFKGGGSEVDDMFFCIKAALSDLHTLCSQAEIVLKDKKIGHLKRFSDPPPKPNLIQQISRKINYYLSWTMAHGSLLVNLINDWES